MELKYLIEDEIEKRKNEIHEHLLDVSVMMAFQNWKKRYNKECSETEAQKRMLFLWYNFSELVYYQINTQVTESVMHCVRAELFDFFRDTKVEDNLRSYILHEYIHDISCKIPSMLVDDAMRRFDKGELPSLCNDRPKYMIKYEQGIKMINYVEFIDSKVYEDFSYICSC